jgi:hypothetical protein
MTHLHDGESFFVEAAAVSQPKYFPAPPPHLTYPRLILLKWQSQRPKHASRQLNLK